MSTQSIGSAVLAAIFVVSLMASITYWSATRCQDGVLAILGTRGKLTQNSQITSLRVLFDNGNLSLTNCSWRGEPKLSWHKDLLDDSRASHRRILHLSAHYQNGRWVKAWRLDKPYSSWRPLDTIFSTLSEP